MLNFKTIFIRFDLPLINPTLASIDAQAFTVKWDEHKYTNGPVIPKTSTVTLAYLDEQVKDTIILNCAESFNNTIGPVTVVYDQTIGTLRATRSVKGFTQSFNATGLTLYDNPHHEEHIRTSLYASIIPEPVETVLYKDPTTGQEDVVQTVGVTNRTMIPTLVGTIKP